MVHKGRSYELAFRRDLSLNAAVNNNGWAKRYHVRFFNCSGVTAFAARATDIIAVTDFIPGSGDLFATSQAFIADGRNCFARLTGSIDSDRIGYEIFMEFHAVPGGLMFKQRIASSLSELYSNVGVTGRTGIIIETPGKFFVDPTTTDFNGIFAVFWSG